MRTRKPPRDALLGLGLLRAGELEPLRATGEVIHHALRQRDYLRLTLVVNLLPCVRRAMVVGVHAREEEQGRDLAAHKRHMVAAARRRLAQLQGQVLRVRRFEDAFPCGSRADAADRDAIVVHPPHHVEVEHGDDVLARHGRVLHKILCAEQALLFGGEGDYQHATLEPVAVLRQQARQLHNRRRARSVVVRAGMDVARLWGKRPHLAVAEMVIVRANHNHLVAQLRVVARNEAHHIARRRDLAQSKRPSRQ